MKSLAILALTMAALFAAAGGASAQYYPGPGVGVYIGPRYDRDYDERRYDRREYERRGYEREYRGGYNREPRYARPAPGGKCQRGYTVQDGFCKPYRGY